jgi:hypothetical protein
MYSRAIILLIEEEMIKKFVEAFTRKFFSNLVQVHSSVTQLLIKKSQETSRDHILSLYENMEVSGSTPLLFTSRAEIQRHIVNLLLSNQDQARKTYLLEFGVFKGTSLRYFAKKLKKFTCVGFDSFEGLQSNFGGVNAQLLFRLKGREPKFMPKNSIIIKGMVEETLDKFILKKQVNISLVHLDLDVYSSTKYVLKTLKPKLQSGTYLLFDEMFGNPFWENGEYKALKDVFNVNEYYWIAFGPNQALIQLR